MLDVNDFIGKSFTTAPMAIVSVPDHSSPTCTGSRYDWFSNPDYKSKFQGQSATISACRELVGPTRISPSSSPRHQGNQRRQRSMATWTTGKKDPSLGWRFTDACCRWQQRRQGYPNGFRSNEWGIPYGRLSSGRLPPVERGGDTTAGGVYSITQYLEWMKNMLRRRRKA